MRDSRRLCSLSTRLNLVASSSSEEEELKPEKVHAHTRTRTQQQQQRHTNKNNAIGAGCNTQSTAVHGLEVRNQSSTLLDDTHSFIQTKPHKTKQTLPGWSYFSLGLTIPKTRHINKNQIKECYRWKRRNPGKHKRSCKEENMHSCNHGKGQTQSAQ